MQNADPVGQDDDIVHSIDMWFSERRKVWIIERLDVDGHLVGSSHCCGHEDDAAACLAEWMRSHHSSVRFVAPPRQSARRPAAPERHAA